MSMGGAAAAQWEMAGDHAHERTCAETHTRSTRRRAHAGSRAQTRRHAHASTASTACGPRARPHLQLQRRAVVALRQPRQLQLGLLEVPLKVELCRTDGAAKPMPCKPSTNSQPASHTWGRPVDTHDEPRTCRCAASGGGGSRRRSGPAPTSPCALPPAPPSPPPQPD